MARDLNRFASVADAEHRYRERYLAGQALRRADVEPEARANIVIDSTDPLSPTITRAASPG